MPTDRDQDLTPQPSQTNAYRAVGELYHAYLTGLILRTVMQRGRHDAAELVFRVFRRQHLEKFIPGLEKLSLTALPDAVAAAQYHYLSNHLGGVNVEFMVESDRKAWIRYVPPRWIFDGTAICAIPTEVSRAMLRAWHAHNGVSLGNPRLGFVCTKQTTDGQPGLEGYYFEYDRDLAPEERLRFEPGEDGPDFDPERAPKLPADEWPEDRRQKTSRNYAMQYVRNIIPETIRLFGPADGGHLARTAARLIGMQYYGRIASLIGIDGRRPEDFARFLTILGDAQGDRVDHVSDVDGVKVSQIGWRLMQGLKGLPPEAFDAWNGLWEGAACVHNRHLKFDVVERIDRGGPNFVWKIRLWNREVGQREATGPASDAPDN
uniref:Uncharacterized protein n=1 Tax=uncultured bacterium FLS18 TaxID=654935 RepID=C6G402_9BACT|nr:hypothetical protein Bpet1938 [uncultured bacterium FLS18]